MSSLRNVGTKLVRLFETEQVHSITTLKYKAYCAAGESIFVDYVSEMNDHLVIWEPCFESRLGHF